MPRPSTLLILAACVLSTGTLLLRQRPAEHPTTSRAPVEGQSRFAVLDPARREVGELTIDRAAEDRNGRDGFATRIESTLRLDLLGATRELAISGVYWIDRSAELAELDARADSEGREIAFSGTIAEGRLRGILSSGGEEIPVSLAIPAEALISGAFATPLDLPRLRAGQPRLELPSFDPLTLSSGRMVIEVEGEQPFELGNRTVDAIALTVDQGGLRARLLVDGKGELLRAETPFGLILERRPPGQPASASSDSAEIVSLAMVRPTKGSATPVRGARRLELRLAAPPALVPPLDERQRRLADGRLEVRAIGPLLAAPGPLPAPAGARGDDSLLAAEALIQSDHPRVRALAESLVSGIDDPWQRALAIHRFVFEEIDKVPTATIPSALEVLASRAGDCNEHSVLYTALARAAGLPTRIAVGVVWSEEHQAFAYHAWPEVLINGRMVATDPTLGEEVADATHLALVTGGVEQWLALGTWIGQLEITVEVAE